MLFNSFQFLLFFPVVTALYFLLPGAWRWPLLLAASCLFYMAFVPKYILILIVLIVVDYTAARVIEGTPVGALRRFALVASVVVTVALLGFFKYFDFLNDNVAQLASLIHWNYGVRSLNIILPIGLSFHTFQSLSYVIEVYRGNQRAERHFGIFALFVMFYPLLVAGPIERPQNLLHQFRETHVFDYAQVTGGLKRMAFGLFKKVVIADALAKNVDQVYDHVHDYAGYPLAFATVCFAWQIYSDFSGYSDMAIGAAQVMGFRVKENFDRPYSARSIAEFWRRWHMSLMSWFRDYIYIPLGGNRVTPARRSLNVLAVFLISGLWHGANWTFVVWGALNGLYVVVSSWTAGIRADLVRATGLGGHPRVHHVLQVATTFLLVNVAWILFRADSMADAWYVATHLFHDLAGDPRRGGLAFNGFILFFVLFMEYVHYVHRKGGMNDLFAGRNLAARWSLYYALVLSIVLFGDRGEMPFIYFQF